MDFYSVSKTIKGESILRGYDCDFPILFSTLEKGKQVKVPQRFGVKQYISHECMCMHKERGKRENSKL
jgi:hypothetical protein